MIMKCTVDRYRFGKKEKKNLKKQKTKLYLPPRESIVNAGTPSVIMTMFTACP